MQRKLKTDYYLGFDVGTNSVGWAATDLNYQLLRFNRKDVWGVRLFDEAKTSADRRTARSARRRLARRVARLKLLQTIFSSEISKVDMGFFQRLKESNLHLEDRNESSNQHSPYTVFVDPDYTDKHFHREYPTMYHLRDAIMSNPDKKFDIRLLYLAIHHIMKSRGHFVFEGQSFENVLDFSLIYENLNDYLQEIFQIELPAAADEIQNIICSKKTIQDKANLLRNYCAENKVQNIWKLCVGGEVSGKDLFDEEELKDTKISFRKMIYDDVRSDLECSLGNRIELIDIAKQVYDYMILDRILIDKTGISRSKICTYEKHQSNLKNIKALYKAYLSKTHYRKMFRSESEKDNYVAYINHGQNNVCSQKDLLKRIKNELNTISPSQEANEADPLLTLRQAILQEITDDDNFLPKQRTRENGNIPYQVHLGELKIILQNQSYHHPFLNEIVDGKPNTERIIELFCFRIPYYVGPLNTTNRGLNTWVVRKDEDNKSPITPWNFTEKVDLEKSAQEFILRMTNKCSYLPTEDVLPKDSLLYSEYMVLNELNKVRIHGEYIHHSLKLAAIENLFKKKDKVTMKDFVCFLVSQQVNATKEDISGFEDKFNSNLASYNKFNKILNEKRMKSKEGERFVEKCILLKCLYGQDKKIFQETIQKEFPNFATAEELKRITKLNFQGWGALSRKLLCELPFEKGIDPDHQLRPFKNIMEALRETNANLMELIHCPSLNNKIESIRKECLSLDWNINDHVADLYLSPSCKRALLQTYKIAQEIRTITGKDPKRIFVEMARGGGEKGQTTEKRKEQVRKLYDGIRNNANNLAHEIESLNEELNHFDDHAMRQKKLFLYFIQLGKCMYSGEKIDLEVLLKSNEYDIDHIYPQSKVKDDSLDNTVLVKKEINNEKSNHIVPQAIRENMKSFWKQLRNHDFISKEKFNRLIRHTEFTAQELEGFEARQLVTTRQATKELIYLFKIMYPNTEIVYSKASLVSEFREQFDIPKLRELNDIHHAQDAYLNIIVGNVHHCKYTKKFYYHHSDKESTLGGYNAHALYLNDVRSRDEIAWSAPLLNQNNTETAKANTLDIINQVVWRKTANVTKMTVTGQGVLFNLTIRSKLSLGQNTDVIPYKPKELQKKLSKKEIAQKYGYFDSQNPAYFVLFKHIKNRVEKYGFDRICLTEVNTTQSKTEIEELLKEKGYNQPQFLRKIYKYQKILVDGHPYRITGFSSKKLELHNDADYFISSLDELYRYKNALKFLDKNKNHQENTRWNVSFKKRENPTDEIETYTSCLERLNTEFEISFQTLKRKLGSEFYSKCLLSDSLQVIIPFIEEKFSLLNLYEKAQVIKNLLIVIGRNNSSPIFKSLGNNREFRIRKPLNILQSKGLVIVDESVTGLFIQKKEIQ